MRHDASGGLADQPGASPPSLPPGSAPRGRRRAAPRAAEASAAGCAGCERRGRLFLARFWAAFLRDVNTVTSPRVSHTWFAASAFMWRSIGARARGGGGARTVAIGARQDAGVAPRTRNRRFHPRQTHSKVPFKPVVWFGVTCTCRCVRWLSHFDDVGALICQSRHAVNPVFIEFSHDSLCFPRSQLFSTNGNITWLRNVLFSRVIHSYIYQQM